MLRFTSWKTNVLALSAAMLLLFAGGTALADGGTGVPGEDGTVTNPKPPPPPVAPPGRAKLRKNGEAIPPSDAPKRIKRAIRIANRIRNKPYIYGGGHASFKSRGYDCSGAVSYLLHAAGLLKSPLPSGSLMRWGVAGKGRWVTVYANGGHTYAVIAGLRWDTSGVNESANAGSGPRWRSSKRSPRGYVARHSKGY